ncbi:MAG: hypothetical protein CL840_14475 [Crocinitomicaceae bacterium]|nr:hypothetical protein [Crocinitomicaceae bacterium]
MRKLKLIWDFRSPDANKIAEHHAKHLREYVEQKEVECHGVGAQHANNSYSIAYMIVNEQDMKPIRDALRPHRGEIYEET